MRTLTLYLALVNLLGFATLALAENIAWEYCPADSNENTAGSCIIHEVRFEPCRTTTSRGFCSVRRGHSASLGFDFTPNFSGGDLQSSVVWKQAIMDLPMDSSMYDLNPCNSTVCPVTQGARQSYNHTFSVYDGSWPKEYKLEWKLWNFEEKACCFIFTINIAS